MTKQQCERGLRFFGAILWIGVLLLIGGQTAVAQDGSSPISLTVGAGFDGYYKQSSWLPVHISAGNSGTAVEGTLLVEADGTIYSTPISLPTQSNKEVTILVFLSRFEENLTVKLLDQDGDILKTAVSNRLNMLTQESLLYGVLSSDPAELGYLENVTGGHASAAVAFLKMEDLAETAVALRPLDILILDDIDSSQISSQQRDAVLAWTSLGGQLLITGGPNWQKTALPLADLLPVSLDGQASMDDLPGLQASIGIDFRDPGPYLVTTSSLQRGELLYHEEGLPLLARQALGRGSIYFLALDPKLAPLLDWDGAEMMWTAVANHTPTLPPWAHGIQNSYAAIEAASSISSLTLPSTGQLLLFLLAYIIIIGPINYFILKRMNRRELAWLTIPVLVLLFSVLTAFTGFKSRGGQIITNQLSVAVGQSGGSHMQVQTVVGLYSPRRTNFDLALPLDSSIRPAVEPFGGFGSNNDPRFDAISRSQELVVEGISSDVSEVTTFLADSVRPLPPITAQISTSDIGNIRKLDINIHNESQIPLENGVLHIDGDIIQLGNLAPGTTQTASHTLTIAAEEGEDTAIFTPSSSPGVPLISQADTILGTYDYYNDPVAYPRWQLLQALVENTFGGGLVEAYPQNQITLIAWSDQPLLETRINNENNSHQYTTLFLIDLGTGK